MDNSSYTIGMTNDDVPPSSLKLNNIKALQSLVNDLRNNYYKMQQVCDKSIVSYGETRKTIMHKKRMFLLSK